MQNTIGIDVSKATLDVACFLDGSWRDHRFSNDLKGFKALIKLAGKDSLFVMEASGPYYLQLALFLSAQGAEVSVVNPLVVKRFSQMRLIRAKTDRKDAQTIAQYARAENPKRWHVPEATILKMQQIITAQQTLSKQMTMVKNQLLAFTDSGIVDQQVSRSLSSTLAHLRKQEEKLQQALQQYATDRYASSMKLLTSIPGIGPKTAALLIVLSDNFQKFAHYKQLIAYVGFSPRVYQSGTSVRGKGHICKIGNALIRKLLYLCTWSAKKVNQACALMYERLKQKGKPERVIKVALANKLLKQAFAIATSGIPYKENYADNPCF